MAAALRVSQRSINRSFAQSSSLMVCMPSWRPTTSCITSSILPSSSSSSMVSSVSSILVSSSSRSLAVASKSRSSGSDSLAFPLSTAVKLVRAMANANFDESVEIAIKLGVDAKRSNQMVRGVAKLPHGTGSVVRVAVFAKGDKAIEAKNAGAEIVGDMDLAQAITEGKIDFTKCIATPDMMPVVGRVARVLGPRGLMPNPKLGTVTMDITEAVRAAKQGQVTFKTDKTGIVHAAVGKVSFKPEQLEENIASLVASVTELKPQASKGIYYRRAFLSSTQGSSVPLDLRLPPFRKSDDALRVDRQKHMAAAVAAVAQAKTSA